MNSSQVFLCGPLRITLSAPNELLQLRAAATLDLYDLVWDEPLLPITIDIDSSTSPSTSPSGTFLNTLRMQVDKSPHGLEAVCRSGASCSYDARVEHWTMNVPHADLTPEVLEDLETLIGLALTTGWRRAGWVPLHAAGLRRDRCSAIVCAASGGGKSTFSAALLRRDWQTLGDDKLLLKVHENGCAEIAALLYHFNLHPTTRRWFPEVGDLERLPVYSNWTEKRRVRLDEIWPGKTIARAHPTHLVHLRRSEQVRGIRITLLDNGEVLSILMRQTVIPTDRAIAQQILSTIAVTAVQLRGLSVELGEDAYADPDLLAAFEAALQ